jgi:hypothetical protein
MRGITNMVEFTIVPKVPTKIQNSRNVSPCVLPRCPSITTKKIGDMYMRLYRTSRMTDHTIMYMCLVRMKSLRIPWLIAKSNLLIISLVLARFIRLRWELMLLPLRLQVFCRSFREPDCLKNIYINIETCVIANKWNDRSFLISGSHYLCSLWRIEEQDGAKPKEDNMPTTTMS